VQLGLLPGSLVYASAASIRSALYRAGLRKTRALPLPAVCIGNLTVGGTGKTPLAAWVARFFAGLGATPAILLRGYGGDETEIHRQDAPSALVIEDANRFRGAQAARDAGADVLVLDDGFQHLQVRRDLDVVVLSAESLRGSRWRLPAGPWREPGAALARAQYGIVTRRRCTLDDARVAERWMRSSAGWEIPIALAELPLVRLEGLWSGREVPISHLRGAALIAAAGIGDPPSFAEQLEDLGARVRLLARRDHSPYSDRDIEWLARTSHAADFLVLTAKDAVKVRHRWPRQEKEPLVAQIGVRWDANQDHWQDTLAGIWNGGGDSRFDQ
jgi:tetraacyldisaccharide 4'-kinase